MDTRKVAIIFDETKFSEESIRKDIIEEGYSFNFTFLSDYPNLSEDYLRFLYMFVSEIWMWGDCQLMEEYKIAKVMNKDLWQMG